MRVTTTGAIFAALPAALAGCFSVPPFTPEGGVTYTEAGGGATIGGPDFELRFAGGDAFHLPESLTVRGVELLGRNPAARCLDEDQVGVRVVPMPRISANGGATRVTNRLESPLRGPAAVQVKLTWATSYGCNLARTPHGTSTFTAFPDGRIVRFDTIVDENPSELVPINCTCDPMPRQEELSFTVSTFWALDLSKLSALHRPGNTSPTPLPAPGLDESNLGVSCVDGGEVQVAFGWPLSEVQGSMTSIRDNSGATLTFGRDLVFRNSILADFSFADSSALVIGRTGCMDALKRAEAHADPQPIMINGSPVKASARDGIHGGDSGTGMAGIAAERVEVSGPVAGSFAVWVRFPGAVEAVRATLDGVAVKGAWYLPQPVEDGSWIVWFRDGISGSQKIQIAPY